MTGTFVLAAFRAAVTAHGIPASTLTDNGMVFTTRLSGGRGGRNALEHELRRLGIKQKNGKPNYPQTQGKVIDSSGVVTLRHAGNSTTSASAEPMPEPASCS